MKFELVIDVTNDTMRSRLDVAFALDKVVAKLRNNTEVVKGSIKDHCGEIVGSWTLTDEEVSSG